MDLQTALPSLNFSGLMAERTRDFTGRDWAFAEIDAWLSNPTGSRYFLITGSPGSGKTALVARLVQTRAIAASYFCIARQDNTLDPLNMARSLSQQLSRIDGFALAILKENNIHIEINTNIHENYGPIIGAQIENLFASTTASQAFSRTVIEPLNQLYRDGYERQVVIVVDALDETASSQGRESIVRLLSSVRGLPLQVRFVLTSRPESSILGQFEQVSITSLLLDAESDKNTRDIEAYVRHQLTMDSADDNALRQQLAVQSLSPETFIDHVTAASKGNFLYLMYLLPAIANTTQQISDLAALPQGLDGIYRDFFRVRIDSGDKTSWHKLYRPLLGTLSIARTALTEEQLIHFTGLRKQDVKDVLLDIQQFLEPVLKAHKLYQFYHQSIADFFGNEVWSSDDFYIDLEPFHERVVDYYRDQATSWQAIQWSALDDYGLLYLADHLIALSDNDEFRQALYALLYRSFMEENYIRYGSHQPFMRVIALAIDAANDEEPPNIVQSIRASLLYAILGHFSNNVPLEALSVLAQTDQVARSLGFVAVMQDQDKQYKGYRAIASALLDQGKLAEARALLKQAWDAAPEVVSKFASMMAPVFARADLTEQALKLMEHTEDASDKFDGFSAIIQSHARVGEVVQVLDMTERIEGHYYKTLTLSEAAQALARGNYINQALTVARSIQDAYRRTLALCSIALTLTGPTQREQARTLAEEALASAQSITVTINGLFGEGDKVIAVCEVVRTWARLAVLKPEDNIIVQALSDAEAIARHAKYTVDEKYTGDEKNAIRVAPPIVRPQQENIPVQVAQKERAENFASSQASNTPASSLPTQSKDVVNVEKLDTEIAELLKARDEAGEAWFAALSEPKKADENADFASPDLTQRLARELAAQAKVHEDWSTIVEKKNREEREKRRAAQLLTRAIQILQIALEKEGRWKEADEQLRDDAFVLSMPWGTPASQRLIMDTNIRGMENTAQAVADRMKAIQDDLNSSQERYSAIGEDGRAAMEEANRAYLLEKVAQAWSLTEHNDKALNVVETIGRNENKVSALAKLAQAYMQAGKNEQARARAAQAFELAKSMHSATALCEAARSLFQVGDTQNAQVAINAALEIVNGLTEWGQREQRAQIVCRMVHLLAWDGPVESVLAEVDKISQKFKASAIGEMALSLLLAGKTERAKKLANEALLAGQISSVEELSWKDSFWGLQRSGLLKESEMMRLEDKTEDIASKWHFSFHVFFERYAQKIHRPNFLSLFTREWENQVKAASAIAQVLCLAGQVNQCQQVTEAMGDPYWKALTLSKMTQIIAQSPHRDVALGMVTRAATIAEAVLEDGLDNSRFILLQCEIAQAWAKLGDVAHTKDAAVKARMLMQKGIQSKRDMSLQVLHSVAQALILACEKADLLMLLAEGVQFAARNNFLLDIDVNFQLDVLREVVNALMAAGYLEETQQLMLELNDQTITVPTMSLEKRTEKQEFSLRALQTEFVNTRFKSKDALFALLERSAFDLSTIDQGQLLWKIYTAVQQINSWFDLPMKAVSQPSQ